MKPWRKLGRIFEPRVLHPLMQSHAANPTVLTLGGSLIRVYFSARAADRRAHARVASTDNNEVILLRLRRFRRQAEQLTTQLLHLAEFIARFEIEIRTQQDSIHATIEARLIL